MMDGCEPLGGRPHWICTDQFFIDTGEKLINCERNEKKHHNAIQFFESDRQLMEEEHDAELSEWHRKWWITMPIGAGAAATVILVLQVLTGGIK